MDIIRGIGQLQSRYRNPVVAIGVFDGIHRGHQTILRYAVQSARRTRGTAIAITFYPHPVHVLHPRIKLPLLVSLPYRLKLMAELGIDVCLVVHFTRQFACLTPEQFVRKYFLQKIRPREVIVGDDFRFGKNRAGTIEDFVELGLTSGFTVSALHAVIKHGHKMISSTRIRRLIAESKVGPAAHLLGRPVSVLGTVVRGDQRGKKLGYPTANIRPYDDVLLPPGVFAVRVRIGKNQYSGVANIGRRPTFKSKGRVTTEVHLFDFEKNIYGQEIFVEILKKIRSEKKFSSRDKLIRQIRLDELFAREWLHRNI